jgi:peptide/nickel transport system ATP-binding protein
MEHILSVENLRMYYHSSKGKVLAIDGVSFDLMPGETLGLVGESGCGKTSLGTSLMRMPTPPGRYEGGRILVNGRDIIPLPEELIRKSVRWEEISMVFQGAMNCLTPVFTIGQQMMETLQEHRPMEKGDAERLIAEFLGQVGLPPETAKRYPHEMSGGMKQRVVIATALFLQPRLVILDEPTTALDVIVQAQIINLLKRLKKEMNLSFIFITHDLALESEVADRICVMYAGKIAEIGKTSALFRPEGAAHPYTRNLLAATPLLHKKVDRLSFIPGTPPDLLAPPGGCRFHPRCGVAMDRCKREEPALLDVGPGHLAACWRCQS